MGDSVWLVTAGVYSSYRVLGVFSARAKAKAYAEKYQAYDSDTNIAKFALNPTHPTFYSGITVEMGQSGSYSADSIGPMLAPSFGFVGYLHFGDEKRMIYTAETDNVMVAVKSANELRTMLLSNDAWGDHKKTRELLKGVTVEDPIK